jgi:hypothetical protein
LRALPASLPPPVATQHKIRYDLTVQRMVTVYCIVSPSDKAYIGWTSQAPRRRWLRHVNDARKGSPLPFHRAIRKYGADAFTHIALERMTTAAGAKRAEALWIKELRTFGSRGYNATAGGEGTTGTHPVRSPEWRAKVAASKKGVPQTPAHRAASSRAMKGRPGRPLSPEHRSRMTAALQALAGSERLKRGPRSPEHTAKIVAALRAHVPTPEQRAKRIEIGRAGALVRWRHNKI